MAPPTNIEANPAYLRYKPWYRELVGDEDRQYIMDGILNGFHILAPKAQL